MVSAIKSGVVRWIMGMDPFCHDTPRLVGVSISIFSTDDSVAAYCPTVIEVSRSSGGVSQSIQKITI